MSSHGPSCDLGVSRRDCLNDALVFRDDLLEPAGITYCAQSHELEDLAEVDDDRGDSRPSCSSRELDMKLRVTPQKPSAIFLLCGESLFAEQVINGFQHIVRNASSCEFCNDRAFQHATKP